MNKKASRTYTIGSKVDKKTKDNIDKESKEMSKKHPYIKKTTHSDIVYWIVKNYYSNKELTKLVWGLTDEQKKLLEKDIKDIL